MTINELALFTIYNLQTKHHTGLKVDLFIIIERGDGTRLMTPLTQTITIKCIEKMGI